MTDEPDFDTAAREWVVRLVSGDVDQEDLAGFKTWQAADPRHAEAFERARRDYADAAKHSDSFRRPGRDWLSGKRVALALAASIAVAVLVAQPELLFPPDYVAGDGPGRALTLSDGTRVLLDGASALDVRIDPGGRKVILRRGRAYFDVRHEARSFVVASGDAVITDLGTAFAVADAGSDGNVQVTQGSVRVEANGTSRTLVAGQGANWENGGLASHGPTPADLAWVQGQIIVRDDTLAEAAAKLDRYIPGRVIVLGGVRNMRVGGTFSTAHATDGLEALARSQGARVRSFPGFVTVSRF